LENNGKGIEIIKINYIRDFAELNIIKRIDKLKITKRRFFKSDTIKQKLNIIVV